MYKKLQYRLQTSVSVQLITDEADALLAILAKKNVNQRVTETDWHWLFSSEGYVRLKKRETELGLSFQDESFKAFVLSDKLAKCAKNLANTLEKWKLANITEAAYWALAYLPEGASIHATVYPLIKPMENSFVFEVKTNPAVFLYLDPSLNEDQFQNILAHEFHHIGYADSCLPKLESKEFAELPHNVKLIVDWIGAFGEGIAMLAAAGGPDIHPHVFSKPEERYRWDQDLSNFNVDIKRIEKFFLDILDQRLTDEEEIWKIGLSFFGLQGPWYTVGWKMAVTIEKIYSRLVLIRYLCKPIGLLLIYNQAATEYNLLTGESLALWSSEFIEGIRKAK
jgi:hypothetical protein